APVLVGSARGRANRARERIVSLARRILRSARREGRSKFGRFLDEERMNVSIRPMILAAFAVVLPLAASHGPTVSAQSQAAGTAPAPKPFGAWGVDLTGMDKTAKPGDDFDQFVNGAWKARTQIPPDQPGTGVGNDLRDEIQAEIRAIIEQAAPDTQLGGMYHSYMDEATLDRLDDKPLQEDLKRVAAITDKDAFTRFMGETNGTFGSALIGVGVGPDPANPTIHTLFIGQAGIGLPDRDYYLSPNFKP